MTKSNKHINYDNEKYTGLFKFGEKQYIDSLYYKGELYLNTFKHFIDLEDNGDGRADRFEGTIEYYAGDGLNGINATLSDGNTVINLCKETGLTSLAYFSNEPEYSHMYCMSCINYDWAWKNNLIIDENNFAKDKDYVVVIHDINKFLIRLERFLVENNYVYHGNHVRYINEKNHYKDMGCFSKFSKYSYQNEWRLALKYRKSKEPIKLSIGSLEDIAFPPQDKLSFYKMSAIIDDKTITNSKILN